MYRYSYILRFIRSTVCPRDKYGKGCSQSCNCNTDVNGQRATCDPINGECYCPPGTEGRDCTKCKLMINIML